MKTNSAAFEAGRVSVPLATNGLSLAVSLAAAIGAAARAYGQCSGRLSSVIQRQRRIDARDVPAAAMDRIREGSGRP